MLSIQDRSTRLCDGISRRELLRVGGLSTLGLSLPALLAASEEPGDGQAMSRSFGRAKNVIFLWLQGGPPQHETFDPKPDAPAEIRGEFAAIQTNIPGVRFGELLPRTAARADKLAVVRSICTNSDLHDASGYWVLTGYPYTGQQSRQISPNDWPYLGSVIKRLKPSKTAPGFTSVWLPDVMRLNDNVMPAGQTAGFLGPAWEPNRLVCDPADPHFQVAGLTLPAEVPPLRLLARQDLLSQVNRHLDALGGQPAMETYGRHSREAFGLLASGRGRQAFDLHREPAPDERTLRVEQVGPVADSRPTVGGSGGEAGSRQLAARSRRRGRLEPPLGHARPKRRPPSRRVVPDLRHWFHGAPRRPRRSRTARRDPGRGHRRIRPHAQDQCSRRARSLGKCFQLRTRRCRHQRRTGVRLE